MKKFLKMLMIALIIVPCMIAFAGCGDDMTTYKVSTVAEFKEALASEEDEYKIVLQNDLVVNEQLVVNKKVVLDMNGKKISNTEDIFDGSVYANFSVVQGGELTFTGNGTIQAKENDCWCVDVNGGDVIVKNGIFIGNCDAIYVTTGNLYIYDGEFSVQQSSVGNDGHERYVVNCEDANYRNETAKIYVYGGKFNNFNPGDCLAEGEDTNFLAVGYTAAQDGDYYVVSKA